MFVWGGSVADGRMLTVHIVTVVTAILGFASHMTIDPEDVGALNNRMLALGALGRGEEFEEARTRYNFHRVDEAEVAVASHFRRSHAAANNESQPIHFHDLHWVGERASFPAGP